MKSNSKRAILSNLPGKKMIRGKERKGEKKVGS